MEVFMTQVSMHRRLALVGALISTVSLAGAAVAAPPNSTHASSTAVTSVGANEAESDTESDSSAHGDTVSAAAQSELTGGAHDNHGGYVSCVARGGSDCTSADQTLPSHGAASSHGQADSHKP
jgi:hypothetical protein